MNRPQLVLTIILGLNSLLIIYCLYWLSQLKRRFQSAFANLDSKRNLGQTIIDYFQKLSGIDQKINNLEKSYQHLALIATKSVQKIGMVRFNPFPDTGGNQSFVIALLDNHDSGLLLTSIHGRQGTRVYVKPVEYGTSKLALSREETAALKSARQHLPKKGKP